MKKKARKKTRRQTLIAVALVTIFGVIVFLGIYQNWLLPQNPPPQEKAPAAEYFQIFNATVDNAQPKFNASGQIIAYEMYSLRYVLKAVKADSHNVIIKSWALAPPETFTIIQKGENVTVVQSTTQSAPYLLSELNTDGKYKFTVNIISTEAEGAIVIWL